MSWLYDLRLISLFNFYLALMFCLSTALRWHQYRAILALVRGLSGRWPNLFKLVRTHTNIFLTWGTFKPLLSALLLLLVNTLASQLLWPEAREFKVRDLLDLWPVLPVVLGTGAAMLAFDIYATWNVSEINREELETYFDQAEYWLRSWKAPVVRIFTLGYVNPRQMVAKEVRSALESASETLNSTLWWVTVQTGLRIAFGLSLWVSYALHDWLRALLHP
jgi:hypothetical protein